MNLETSAQPADFGPVIDARGMRCPAPVLTLGHRISGIQVGAVLSVLADDPAAATDIPAWCALRGQELLEARTVTAAEVQALAPGAAAAEPIGTLRLFRVRRTR